MQEEKRKRYSTSFVRKYIEENLHRYGEEKHMSEDEGNWFVSQLLQLEQVEALQRIANALEGLEAVATEPK